MSENIKLLNYQLHFLMDTTGWTGQLVFYICSFWSFIFLLFSSLFPRNGFFISGQQNHKFPIVRIFQSSLIIKLFSPNINNTFHLDNWIVSEWYSTFVFFIFLCTVFICAVAKVKHKTNILPCHLFTTLDYNFMCMFVWNFSIHSPSRKWKM